MSNFQTLGEEYTGILLVKDNYLGLPSKWIRMIMVILQCYGYSIARKILSFTGEYYRKENATMENGKIDATMSIFSGIIMVSKNDCKLTQRKLYIL